MQLLLFVNGLFAVLLALAIGVVVAVLGYRAVLRLDPSIDEEAELRSGNLAVAIVTGSFIFALGYLLKSAVDPIAQTVIALVFTIQMSGFDALGAAMSLGAVLAQFAAALAVAFSALWLGTRVFMGLNRSTDEAAEIAANNVAVAVLVAFITITLAVVLEPGVQRLLDVMIPTPAVDNASLRPIG